MHANQFDTIDTLNQAIHQFSLPENKIYLCSHSLGLPAKQSFELMHASMSKWSQYGAHAWFVGDENWYVGLSEQLSQHLSLILGSQIDEVVVMNSLTVNLHLLLTSFYRPTKERFKMITDSPAFPSDLYALKSHLQRHYLNPNDALSLVKFEDLEEAIEANGESTALVYLNAVNYLTGEVLDIEKISKLAHRYGCIVGLDLAHAAGNIPLSLHQSGVDFAVGCGYKYLCGGPGAPGFAFVHSKHHQQDLPRFSGWWGNDPAKRFQMYLQHEFQPHGGAASWQVSTPSILAMQPLLASLQVFSQFDMSQLRKKSELQTDYLIALLDEKLPTVSLVTPRAKHQRGCQVSFKINGNAKEQVGTLIEQNIICDFRPPDIIRVAISPLYNTFEDIDSFIKQL